MTRSGCIGCALLTLSLLVVPSCEGVDDDMNDNWKPGLFGPDGQLRDYMPRPGDPQPPPGHVDQTSHRQRWGQRVWLNTDPTVPTQKPFTRPSATVVDTGDLGRSHLIDVQFRFALTNTTTGNAELPFVPTWSSGNSVGLKISVKRGLDPQATVAEDTYFIVENTTNMVPFDIVAARSLTINVELTLPGGNLGQVWLDCIATIVDDVSTKDRVIGYPVGGVGVFVPAVASPGRATIAAASSKRVQFIVVNTSTNANLILSFDSAASWVGPHGNIVLPANSFATYESPIGGYSGIVTGSWDVAVPNGGALVSSGSYF